MGSIELRSAVLLAMQSSLLGMITPNMRAITCSYDESDIIIKFVFDNTPDADENELCEDFLTEMLSHFDSHKISLQVISIPIPENIKGELLDNWIYMRRE